MKKNLLRIFCIVLALTMLVGLMPVLAAEDDVTVYVSVSEQGVLAETKDGAPAAQLEVAALPKPLPTKSLISPRSTP